MQWSSFVIATIRFFIRLNLQYLDARIWNSFLSLSLWKNISSGTVTFVYQLAFRIKGTLRTVVKLENVVLKKLIHISASHRAFLSFWKLSGSCSDQNRNWVNYICLWKRIFDESKNLVYIFHLNENIFSISFFSWLRC